MKSEDKETIVEAMPLIISSLEVDVSFLSVFEAKGIFTEYSVQEIQVSMNKTIQTFGTVWKLINKYEKYEFKDPSSTGVLKRLGNIR